ncbi:RNA-directed DNA polymerase, eukaryota [Tanacetum coccineum]
MVDTTAVSDVAPKRRRRFPRHLTTVARHLWFRQLHNEERDEGNTYITVSHIFYADDAMFLGEWSDSNLKGILNILKSFFLASGLQINVSKSQLLGVGVSRSEVDQAASSIGCSVMNNQFRYLGVMVGQCPSRLNAWDDIIFILRARLSKWKVKTLSIGIVEICEGYGKVIDVFIPNRRSKAGRFKYPSLSGFPAQSVGSSNTDVLDLPCLLVLITGTSQSRQHGKSESDSYYLSDYVVNSFPGTSLIHIESHHRFFPVDTSLIHIESRKSPTAVLFDDDTGRDFHSSL